MLPISLVSGSALRTKVGFEFLPLQVRVVVADLVVVPDQQPRHARVDGLQGRVALVGGIAGTVLLERSHDARALERAHRVLARRVLVDVVAEEHHEVEFFGGHVAPGRVMAHVETLAACDGEVQRARAVGGRRGAGAADGALLAECAKAVPVPAVRIEAGGLGVHAVRPRRFGNLFATRDDVAKPFVAGDLPLHGHAGRQCRAGQPGPQHDGVGTWLAGRDAQRKSRQVSRAARRQQPRCGDQRGAAAQQRAARCKA